MHQMLLNTEPRSGVREPQGAVSVLFSADGKSVAISLDATVNGLPGGIDN